MRNINAEDVIQCIRLMKPVISINRQIAEDITLEDTLFDKSIDIEGEIIQRELQAAVRQAVSRLDKKQQIVLIYRYGLYGRPCLSYVTIGKMLGYSSQGIANMEARALEKLRYMPSLKRYYEEMVS
jgi:RNA polymerase sigma factor (sigma-70 family)